MVVVTSGKAFKTSGVGGRALQRKLISILVAAYFSMQKIYQSFDLQFDSRWSAHVLYIYIFLFYSMQNLE